MLNFYHIHSQQTSLPTWVSQMRRNSLRIAPVSAIPPISSTQTHQKNSSDTSSNTNTGHHSKWSQPVLKLTTTRDIARQILRHRSFSFQEFSQRYADPTKDLSFVLREARLQDPKNRQNSVPLDGTLGHAILQDEWRDRQLELIRLSKETYEWAVNKGIAKEQARAVLPEGLTVSRLYMNGTLRSWIHFIELRSANGTQKEHQDVAIACAKVIAEIFPMTTDLVAQ
jgi:thymidylate synthase (FAD)